MGKGSMRRAAGESRSPPVVVLTRGPAEGVLGEEGLFLLLDPPSSLSREGEEELRALWCWETWF
jgi:hypothetical protein